MIWIGEQELASALDKKMIEFMKTAVRLNGENGSLPAQHPARQSVRRRAYPWLGRW